MTMGCATPGACLRRAACRTLWRNTNDRHNGCNKRSEVVVIDRNDATNVDMTGFVGDVHAVRLPQVNIMYVIGSKENENENKKFRRYRSDFKRGGAF